MHTIINAQRQDKALVVDILRTSFADDPHINWLVDDGRNKQCRMKRLMSYAFEHALVNGSVQLTEDKKAVAIWKNHHSHKMSFHLLLENIKFLFAFGFKRLSRIIQMEKKISSRYPKDRFYNYLWFIGTLPSEQGKGYGSALLRPELKRASEEKHPVYLETTTETNLSYYRKKGFILYDKILLNEINPMTIFLLRLAERN